MVKKKKKKDKKEKEKEMARKWHKRHRFVYRQDIVLKSSGRDHQLAPA